MASPLVSTTARVGCIPLSPADTEETEGKEVDSPGRRDAAEAGVSPAPSPSAPRVLCPQALGPDGAPGCCPPQLSQPRMATRVEGDQ